MIVHISFLYALSLIANIMIVHISFLYALSFIANIMIVHISFLYKGTKQYNCSRVGQSIIIAKNHRTVNICLMRFFSRVLMASRETFPIINNTKQWSSSEKQWSASEKQWSASEKQYSASEKQPHRRKCLHTSTYSHSTVHPYTRIHALIFYRKVHTIIN